MPTKHAYFPVVHSLKGLLFSCRNDNNSPAQYSSKCLSCKQKKAECGNIMAPAPTVGQMIDVPTQEVTSVAPSKQFGSVENRE